LIEHASAPILLDAETAQQQPVPGEDFGFELRGRGMRTHPCKGGQIREGFNTGNKINVDIMDFTYIVNNGNVSEFAGDNPVKGLGQILADLYFSLHGRPQVELFARLEGIFVAGEPIVEKEPRFQGTFLYIFRRYFRINGNFPHIDGATSENEQGNET